MSDQSYIQQLEQQLADERAYIQILETTIDLKVEQRVAAEIAKAEQDAFLRGSSASNFTNESFKHYGKALQAELEAVIPTMLERVIPERFTRLYHPQPVCRVETITVADTLERMCHVSVVIPEFRIESRQIVSTW